MKKKNLFVFLVTLGLVALQCYQPASSAQELSQTDVVALFPPVGTKLRQIQQLHHLVNVDRNIYAYSGTLGTYPFASMIIVENEELAQAWVSILSNGEKINIEYWNDFMSKMGIPLADPNESEEFASCLDFAPALEQDLNPFQLGRSGDTYFEGVHRLIGKGYSVINFRMTSFANNSPYLKGYFKKSADALQMSGQLEGANVLQKYVDRVFGHIESRDECKGPDGYVSGPTIGAGLDKRQSKAKLMELISNRHGKWKIKADNYRAFAKSTDMSEPEIALAFDDYGKSRSYQETYVTQDIEKCAKIFDDLNSTRGNGHIKTRYKHIQKSPNGYSFYNSTSYSAGDISRSWSEPQNERVGCKVVLEAPLTDHE